jgi:hypothetical protein
MAILQQSLDTDWVESSSLSEEKAWERLTELVGAERLSPHDLWKQHVVSQLCEWLGYQPLGLELVGRYLAENPNLSWGEMLKQLQVQRLEEEAINPSELGIQPTLNTAQRRVKAAFELIWQNLDPTTQHVGEFLSLFAPEVIPWQLVEFVSKQLSWEKENLNRARQQLEKWQLIQLVKSSKDYYQINPLTRKFIQAKQQVSDNKFPIPPVPRKLS